MAILNAVAGGVGCVPIFSVTDALQLDVTRRVAGFPWLTRSDDDEQLSAVRVAGIFLMIKAASTTTTTTPTTTFFQLRSSISISLPSHDRFNSIQEKLVLGAKILAYQQHSLNTSRESRRREPAGFVVFAQTDFSSSGHVSSARLTIFGL
ncbi:hypothetical protein EST38_g6425 [Candolleomyces aberdarensis]|uniref:Uncharacterized protein n=1 Tax=Candolleomyces aberdarensis TaxID=2316362 RepID=A0A4Q2DHP6_9AGAR|nr:hypothetical protein EST38_g6425 [Candolleomyces aberdarensis]